MAKTGKISGAVSMAGLKVGNIRFFERGGKVYSRVATTRYMPNERTGAQMMNRLRFSSVQLLWNCFKNELKGSFEDLKPGKSAYTTFMKMNHNNGVFLTKDQQYRCYQIITPLHISEGTLESIRQYVNDNQQLVTDISLGDSEITAETTIRDFSMNVISNNHQMAYGDELHLVAAIQKVSDTDVPRCDVNVVNLKLDLNDERLLLGVLGRFPLYNKDGYLATKTNLEKGCYAFYLSRDEQHQTRVSSQKLISNNEDMIERYISEEQFTTARKSFGKSEDAWLFGWKFQKPTFD